MIAEKQDSEAADIQVGIVEVTKSRQGELRHKLWTTAEILLVAMTGEAAMTVTEGMVDAIDVLEEKMNTPDARSQTCKARLVVEWFKASHLLHLRQMVHHLHKNGSVVLRAATISHLTTGVVAVVVVVVVATSEAQGVKTIATEAVDLAVRKISCSRREGTGANAGMKMGPDLHRETSTRREDAVGGRMSWWNDDFELKFADSDFCAIRDDFWA